MGYRVDQEIIYKPLNQRAVIRHAYQVSQDGQREYRISLIGGKADKIVSEVDLRLQTTAPTTSQATGIGVFHFTDSRNLPSIKKFGLLSWELLEHRNISHVPASNSLSREIDARKNLQGYVRLCIQPAHKMAYIAQQERRVVELVWLSIDPVILRWKTTLFSDRNAAHKEAIINGNPNTALRSEYPDPEVLIQNALSSKWISFP